MKTQTIINQSPQVYGFEQSRWSLKNLLFVCSYLGVKSNSSLWNWLRKWRIRYQRGRCHVHSPDEYYKEKMAYIKTTIKGASPENSVFLCLDELTIYAHPTVASAYGKEQPLAKQGLQSNKSMRIIGVLNLLTGKVNYFIRNKISIATIYAFYENLVKTYPNKQIYIIQDNWPVHYHPDVLAALQTQEFPYGYPIPASWKNLKPNKKYIGKNLPIKLLALPTYASWLNVIEKLWKKLKQELIHMHPYKDQFDLLKNKVANWLDKYTTDSRHEDLRKYVGLLNPENFLGQICTEIYPNFKERLIYET